MKVLLVNGGPHASGAINRDLLEAQKILNEEGIDTELIQIGNKVVKSCLGCEHCHKNKTTCIFGDLDDFLKKFEEADGLVIGSPVHYAGITGATKSFFDRVFYCKRFDASMKVGAAITNARRAGTTAAFDQLNKYFVYCGMPIAPASYWTVTHGNSAEEVEKDLEGLGTVRNMAHNMAYMIKAFKLAKEQIGEPIQEPKARTNFIR